MVGRAGELAAVVGDGKVAQKLTCEQPQMSYLADNVPP
jgi:hypothetical protein